VKISQVWLALLISTSLLPSAVNADICLLYSILLKTDAVMSDSESDAADFTLIGGISFALTAINIICIWVSGLVMFEIKEVAPNKGQRPPPVNVGVLRYGLKAALRKYSDKPIEVKIRPSKRRPYGMAS
jgi:hypothetical protein